MKIGLLYSQIRPEEKFIINELRSRAEVELVLIDDRTLEFNLSELQFEVDLVLNRSISTSRALNAIRLFECMGVKCVNSHHTASICADKLLTSAVLREHDIPQPEVRVAFSEEAALSAMQKMGFPVVLKPAVGSWGRLLSKINDPDAARAILSHKRVLGTYQHSVFYLQKYVRKQGRDIRSIVVGGECIAAAYRTSEHWITNAARGGISVKCEVTDEIREISIRAARAVGGDIVAIDLFEMDPGYLVNEINDTMEFKGCFAATGINIPVHIADFLLAHAPMSTNACHAGSSVCDEATMTAGVAPNAGAS
ncbi:MAG: lysine biosynthesis protein LysX [bacterium]